MADIRSYDEYLEARDDFLNTIDDFRKQLIAQCKQLYNYVKSAKDYSDIDIESWDDMYDDMYDVINPSQDSSWADQLSDAEYDEVYRLNTDMIDAYNEVGYIVSTIESIYKSMVSTEEDLDDLLMGES